MSKIIKLIWNLVGSSFIKRVITLQVGNTIGTITQAICGVFIARLLQPELFGVYTLAFAIAAMFAILVGSGIQEATSNLLGAAHARSDRKELLDILVFSFKITAWAALVTIIISIAGPFITDFIYGSKLIGFYASFIIIGVIFSSLAFGLTSSILQVAGQIKSFSILTLKDSILRFGLSLLFVFLGWGVLGAVLGQLVGAVILSIFAIRAWYKISLIDSDFPSPTEVIRNFRNVSVLKYIKFTFWVAADRNLASLFSSMPLVLSGIYLSISDVTFFKLAFGYVNLALSLLGPISVLLNIEFPRLSVLSRSSLLPSFVKVSFYSIILSSVVTLGALIVGPIAFEILYGQPFRTGATYAWGLVIYGMLFGLGVGLGPMWRAVNQVKTSLVINLITLGIGIPLGLILVKLYGPWGATAMVTIWFTLSHAISFIYLYRYLRR